MYPGEVKHVSTHASEDGMAAIQKAKEAGERYIAVDLPLMSTDMALHVMQGALQSTRLLNILLSQRQMADPTGAYASQFLDEVIAVEAKNSAKGKHCQVAMSQIARAHQWPPCEENGNEWSIYPGVRVFTLYRDDLVQAKDPEAPPQQHDKPAEPQHRSQPVVFFGQPSVYRN